MRVRAPASRVGARDRPRGPQRRAGGRWSSLRVAGTPLRDALDGDDALAYLRDRVEPQVRFANITIIEGNDASQFGIGVACAQIAEAVLRDEGVVLPVAAYREHYGVTLALPTVVGRGGAVRDFEPSMSAEERNAFHASAATLREAARGVLEPGRMA